MEIKNKISEIFNKKKILSIPIPKLLNYVAYIFFVVIAFFGGSIINGNKKHLSKDCKDTVLVQLQPIKLDTFHIKVDTFPIVIAPIHINSEPVKILPLSINSTSLQINAELRDSSLYKK